MNLDKVIKSRKSVRKFSDKKPDWREIIKCIDAARYAPIAGGNNISKFILIDDKEKINKLSDYAQQDFISQANYVVVFCSNPSRLKNAYGKKGDDYTKQQTGAAIQNFLLKIEESGLSTCWIGHFVEKQVKNLLKIPNEVNVEAMFPIGYDSEKKKTKKAPTDMDNLLYFNEYENKRMKKSKKLNV
ncbi:MAG: nitroreductase family protein [Candidatus Pacearchaeota archaeon]